MFILDILRNNILSKFKYYDAMRESMSVRFPTIQDISDEIRKKSNVQRRQETTQKIIEASFYLFKTQGYGKTTTRQIAQRAGVLNGSIYNIFGSKEDILNEIIMNGYDSALREARTILKDEDDLVLTLAFPLAIDLYTASSFQNASELLLEVHRSWKITNELAKRTSVWVMKYLEKYNISMDSETVRTNLLAILGSVGNFVSRYYHDKTYSLGYKKELRISLELFCTLFRIPAYNIDSTVERMSDLLNKGKITIGNTAIGPADKE